MEEKLTFKSKGGTMTLELCAEFVQKAIESDSISDLKNIVELMNSFEARWNAKTAQTNDGTPAPKKQE